MTSVSKIHITLLLKSLTASICLLPGRVANATLTRLKQKSIWQVLSKSASYKFRQALRCFEIKGWTYKSFNLFQGIILYVSCENFYIVSFDRYHIVLVLCRKIKSHVSQFVWHHIFCAEFLSWFVKCMGHKTKRCLMRSVRFEVKPFDFRELWCSVRLLRSKTKRSKSLHRLTRRLIFGAKSLHGDYRRLARHQREVYMRE